METRPSPVEIELCIQVLQSLQPSDLPSLPQEFVDAGHSLFTKSIKTKLFGEEDVVNFLQQKAEYQSLLKRLERVHEAVQKTHASFVESASCAGINSMREARAAEVNLEGVSALTTRSGLLTLLENLESSAQPLISNTETVEESQTLENPSICQEMTGHYQNESKQGGSGFRPGGLGRSRGRKSRFDPKKICGLHERSIGEGEEGISDKIDAFSSDPLRVDQGGDSGSAVRRAGTIFLLSRLPPSLPESTQLIESPPINPTLTPQQPNIERISSRSKEGEDVSGLGMVGYVQDSEDGVKRAVALRTIVQVSSALKSLGIDTSSSTTIVSHACSYVIGARKQKWALLGGEIQGLSGETAISVRLTLEDPTQTSSQSEDSKGDAEFVVPPVGSFRRHCNVCKQPYLTLHSFYHQLCPPCGDFNLKKRLQTANLNGYVCLVTGGRVRIGYQIALKLLRAGGQVIVTSRWPRDALLRYSKETDFLKWAKNLIIDELELSDIEGVEEYCRVLTSRYSRIHVLINNAAQTITRPGGWRQRMTKLDSFATQLLSVGGDYGVRSIERGEREDSPSIDLQVEEIVEGQQSDHRAKQVQDQVQIAINSILSKTWNFPFKAIETSSPSKISSEDISFLSSLKASPLPDTVPLSSALNLDESGQPLDRSGVNSWSRRLSEVSTAEAAQTMAVNALAPFVLCSKLKTLLTPESLRSPPDDSNTLSRSYSHIVNVTALEGKFNVGKKSGGHPHTNMAKAALNMMTLTGARDYAREGILMNSVDTGWVTDMSPGGVGKTAAIHETFIGPPLDDEDGAARVIDPVFSHILSSGQERPFGGFFKDYLLASW